MPLADFALKELLGKGTYGRVHRAVRRSDGAPCVVKEVPLQGLCEAEQKEALNESRVLSRVHHDHVVKYISSFIEDSHLHIVMEFAAGGDMAHRIKTQRGAPIEEEVLWKYLVQLTQGLKCLHDENIIHRDIKTVNVFLDAHDNVKIGDLGLGRILGAQSFANTEVGTPLYYSPEICEGRPYRFKSDIWALGCLLYELCTFRPPFTATNQITLAKKIVAERPDPIPQHYSMELRFLVSKLLEKDPSHRPDVSSILGYSAVRIRIDRARLRNREQTLERHLREQRMALDRERKELEAERAAMARERKDLEAELVAMARERDQCAGTASALVRSNQELQRRLIGLESELAASLHRERQVSAELEAEVLRHAATLADIDRRNRAPEPEPMSDEPELESDPEPEAPERDPESTSILISEPVIKAAAPPLLPLRTSPMVKAPLPRSSPSRTPTKTPRLVRTPNLGPALRVRSGSFGAHDSDTDRDRTDTDDDDDDDTEDHSDAAKALARSDDLGQFVSNLRASWDQSAPSAGALSRKFQQAMLEEVQAHQAQQAQQHRHHRQTPQKLLQQ